MHPQIWLRRTLLSGLAVLVPVGLTLYVLSWLVHTADGLLGALPTGVWGQYKIPGTGLVFAFSVTLLVGMLARNFAGKFLVRWFQRALERIPVVASVYKLFRQIAETFIGESAGGKGFKGVVLVEWPRAGTWTLAFVTSNASPIFADRLPREKEDGPRGPRLNLFIPTTPNPTSGFYAIVRAEEVVPVPLTVEQAFKVIISGGALAPA